MQHYLISYLTLGTGDRERNHVANLPRPSGDVLILPVVTVFLTDIKWILCTYLLTVSLVSLLILIMTGCFL
jgi:hypothetical protein